MGANFIRRVGLIFEKVMKINSDFVPCFVDLEEKPPMDSYEKFIVALGNNVVAYAALAELTALVDTCGESLENCYSNSGVFRTLSRRQNPPLW